MNEIEPLFNLRVIYIFFFPASYVDAPLCFLPSMDQKSDLSC